MKKKTIILSVITVVWMLLIFSLSSQNGTQTTELSTTCAEKVANVIYQVPTEEQIQYVHSYIRKMVLSFLGAVAVTSCFSFLDEWHKQFIDGRHFQMEEVALNVCSGIVVIAIACAVKRAWNGKYD